ncbi:hypothetical protein [Albimonas pacifica]|uniref:Uncharacterized protein n=1 Tax=Albimonas pacifica TaxID=1114924 RepID=A0A1I3LWA3_9RHOB|nr:hypothetical protein [Albimonas pacifica]SFI88957.1 hypothetical protein SAMN05216258_110202 [Albimonas pacifica]
MTQHPPSVARPSGPARPRRARSRVAAPAAAAWLAVPLAALTLAAGPAAAQYQPNLPSVARQPLVQPCCEPYDARGAARGLSLQQQAPGPLSAPPRVESLAPAQPQQRAPVETRPGMALQGTGADGPGTVYDGPSRDLFRPVKPPAPLD